MTQHSHLTRGQMNSLKLQTLNALFTVFDREIEARDARDAQAAQRLYKNREKLRTVVLELRRAEAVFNKSEQPVCHAEGVLQDAANSMKHALRLMQRPTTVNDGASQAISLLRGLPVALK